MSHKKDNHELYIDDLSEGEAINLKKQLIRVNRPQPHNFHERTGHALPAGSLLQKQLHKIEEFTVKNKMKINMTNNAEGGC